MNSYNIDRTDYERIQSKLTNHFYAVTNYYGITHSELRWNHHFEYMKKHYNLSFEVIDPTQSPAMASLISGRTDLINDKVVVSVVNEEVKGRRTFTLMHELVHVLLHYKHDDFGYFTGQIEMDDTLKETEANVGASLLMAHDDIIDDLISEYASFDQMKHILGYSSKGLHSRLIDYLEFTALYNKPQAKQLVNSFRFSGNTDIAGANELSKELRYELYREYAPVMNWGNPY